MKFLCIPCDSPMKLQTVGPPERGSLSVVYSCPECGYEIAMLTNAYETQIVQSLGVRIGPEIDGATSSSATSSATERGVSGGGCPFASMIPATEGALAQPASPGTETQPFDPAQGMPGQAPRDGSSQAGELTTIRWTAAAEARLERVPAFVRPMARAGIERFAREKGSIEIDEKILDAARDFFGM